MAYSSIVQDTLIQTIWKKEMLDIAEPLLVLDKWAVTDGVPMKGGDTFRFNRVLRALKQTAKKTTPGTLLKADSGSLKQLQSNKLDFNVETWEDGFYFTEYEEMVSLLNDKQQQAAISDQFARTHEYQLMKRICEQGLWWRIDKDPLLQVFGTVDSATSTDVVDDALTQVNGHWDGARIGIYNPSGMGYDQCVPVTAFTAADDTLKAAFTNTPTTASKYLLSSKNGLAAGNKMTTVGLLDAAGVHEHMRTPKFNGNTLRAVMSAAQHRDLHDDTEWKAYVQYDRSGVVKNYEPLRWFDIEALVADEVYRSDINGTENQDAGAVHSCPVFGAGTYGVARYGHGSGLFNVNFNFIDKPDFYDTTGARKVITWKSNWTGGVLRATGVVVLNTGATGLGFDTFN